MCNSTRNAIISHDLNPQEYKTPHTMFLLLDVFFMLLKVNQAILLITVTLE